jgi:hypothetical protein
MICVGEVDRKKHDVDVLERVLGGIRDSAPAAHSTPLCDVDVPWLEGSSARSTVELTVGLPDEPEPPESRHRK